MKNLKQIIFLLFLVIFFASPNLTHAEKLQCDEFDWELDCYTLHDTDDDLKGYNIGEYYVIYDYCKVKCADKSTFEKIQVLDETFDTYGRDKNYLFFGTKRLADIDPDNFKAKTIDEGDYYLVYDDDAVWLNGVRYDTFDPETLEFITIRRSEGLVYLKDKNHVYSFKRSDGMTTFQPIIVEGADPEYFTFGYKITEDAVYWRGKRIWEADLNSFEVRLLWSNEIATDKNNVYKKGEILYGVDVKTYQSYDIKREGMPILEVSLNKNNADAFKQEYPQEASGIDQSIQTAIDEYEEKYPNYEPQPAEPGIFTDISTGHPLYGATKTASEDGWINGYPDKSFQPEKSVNRAEFAKMLMIAFEKGDGDGKNLSKFPDVDLSQWYKPFLSKAVELGIMQGYPDGMMRPGNTINRAEALKMTLEILGNVYPEKPNQQWYEKYRSYAEENYDLDFLDVEDMGEDMTRGECVELILEAM